MDFAIPEGLRPKLDTIDRFLRDEVFPREGRLMSAGFLTVEPELKELRQKVKALGLWAPQAPKELGGMGLSLLEHGLVSERLGRTPFGHFIFGCQAPDAGNIEILHKFGSADQKKQYLEPLVRGDLRSCFSMTEPQTPGSNPTQLACTAVKNGSDYVINGRKWFTSSADGSAFAVVMAVTNPEAPSHLRATQIIVPTSTKGFRLIRNIPVMGHTGEGWMSHAEVAYEDCRVPQSNRLGPEGQGFGIAQERLGPGRIHHCMRWIGICERSFELMCQRASSRHIDGDETLANKQIIQCWVAECRARIDAARWMVLDAAWKIDRDGFHAAQIEVSLIKFFVADVMMEVVDRAIQVHGALGITSDTVLSAFYMLERGSRIYDGPDEVHKIVAGKRLLKRFDTSQPSPR
jgi:acyl-CoA dehydrogenase